MKGREMTQEEVARNERRITLIERESLTTEEQQELDALQTWIGVLLAEIAPYPRISDDPELMAALARLR